MYVSTGGSRDMAQARGRIICDGIVGVRYFVRGVNVRRKGSIERKG